MLIFSSLIPVATVEVKAEPAKEPEAKAAPKPKPAPKPAAAKPKPKLEPVVPEISLEEQAIADVSAMGCVHAYYSHIMIHTLT